MTLRSAFSLRTLAASPWLSPRRFSVDWQGRRGAANVSLDWEGIVLFLVRTFKFIHKNIQLQALFASATGSAARTGVWGSYKRIASGQTSVIRACAVVGRGGRCFCVRVCAEYKDGSVRASKLPVLKRIWFRVLPFVFWLFFFLQQRAQFGGETMKSA